MIYSKPIVDLDTVLDAYASSSETFDANVLNDFIEKYPQHAKSLQRYAQVQLTFKQPTRKEVEAVQLNDEELLPQQSKLLERMQQLRGTPSPADIEAAGKKLASISGETGVADAALAIFKSIDHGEDILLVSITDSTSPVRGVPKWFYDDFGRHLNCSSAALGSALAMKRQQHIGAQRFSTQDKLAEGPPISWEQLIEECITDEAVKQEILERSKRS